MPVTIKSTGGGSVTVQAPNTASDYTVNLPAGNGDLFLASGAVTVAQGGTGQTSLTANNVILGNGTSAVQFVAPGSSGNVLTSNGTTWTSGTAPVINVQTFTSSGTWTKPSGYAAGSRVLIQAWGGGGGGGRGNASFYGGGGGGGYNERWLTFSDMGSTETVTVGSGGAARTTDGHGNDGGNTSVGSLITAYGGGGGSGIGGSGGGQLSAGANGSTGTFLPGKPWFYLGQESNNGYVMYVGAGGTPNSTIYSLTIGNGTDAFVHGAGGAGGATNKIGGSSVWGGGGGSTQLAVTGGSSSFGGAGGAAGVSGTAPGGGGGGVTGATSGAGGAGRVIITVFPA